MYSTYVQKASRWHTFWKLRRIGDQTYLEKPNGIEDIPIIDTHEYLWLEGRRIARRIDGFGLFQRYVHLFWYFLHRPFPPGPVGMVIPASFLQELDKFLLIIERAHVRVLYLSTFYLPSIFLQDQQV